MTIEGQELKEQMDFLEKALERIAGQAIPKMVSIAREKNVRTLREVKTLPDEFTISITAREYWAITSSSAEYMHTTRKVLAEMESDQHNSETKGE